MDILKELEKFEIERIKALPLNEQLQELRNHNCPHYTRYFYGHDSNEYAYGCDYNAKNIRSLPNCKPTKECLCRF